MWNAVWPEPMGATLTVAKNLPRLQAISDR